MDRQPFLEVAQFWRGVFSPNGEARLWALTADVLFNAIKGGDLPQPLFGNGRGGISGNFMQLAPGMCPAIGQLDILVSPFEQPVVSGIAVDLQDAGEAFQYPFSIFTGTPGRIGDQPRRSRGLHHPVCAGPAGIFRTADDDYAELCRNHIEPLADIFANHMPFRATTAGRALGLDHLLNAQ